MDTLTIPAAVAENTSKTRRPRIWTRGRARAAAILATITVMVAPTAAFATTVDATGGAGASFIDDLKSQFLSYVVPAALGLMVAVLGISVLVSWGRKAVKSR